MTDNKKSTKAHHSTENLPKKMDEKEIKIAGASDQAKTGGKAASRVGKPHKDFTRFGDWEKNGRCIDF